MNDKILTYAAGVVGALAFGVVASQYASNADAGFWMCVGFFVGGAGLGVITYYVIVVAIKMLFDHLMKGRIKAEEVEIEEPKEIPQPKAEPIIINIQQPLAEPAKMSATAKTVATDEILAVKEEKSESLREEITEDMIFKLRMYEKYLIIEGRLIKDGCLNENLEWIAINKGRKDIKKLIILLDGLINEGYFMPYRDNKVKLFFERRYNVELKQNFEPSRRKQYEGDYKIVFYNYPF